MERKLCRVGHCALGLALAIVTGCASYTTPGRRADLTAVGAPASAQFGPGTDPLIREALDKKPLAKLPTAIAVVRIQAPGYSSATTSGWGEGAYSIVTTRDIEKPDQIERLNRLPLVQGVAPVNRLLINGKLDSDVPLRHAAAKLQADMLLIYTIDTVFNTQDKARPLTVISLGLMPNQQVHVTCTASALIMDTRNGYLYGLAEATAQQTHLTNAWQNDDAVDNTRRQAESEAFGKLVGEIETTWKGIILRQVVAGAN